MLHAAHKRPKAKVNAASFVFMYLFQPKYLMYFVLRTWVLVNGLKMIDTCRQFLAKKGTPCPQPAGGWADPRRVVPSPGLPGRAARSLFPIPSSVLDDFQSSSCGIGFECGSTHFGSTLLLHWSTVQISVSFFFGCVRYPGEEQGVIPFHTVTGIYHTNVMMSIGTSFALICVRHCWTFSIKGLPF